MTQVVTNVLTKLPPARAAAAAPALPAWPRNLPPVILLGGAANALSVARQIGRLGAQVYALPEPPGLVVHSRYCRRLRPAGTWEQFLLGPESDFLRGAVLLACSDEGLQLIAARREQLAERFLLDDSNPAAQRQMLDKLSTYRAAAAAGVPTPKFWVADSRAQLEAVRGELVFPLVVKPRLSHVFENKTGKKLLVVNDYDGVAAAVDEIAATGTACLLMELIPGADDRLCSYFTYLDADSKPMFDFTKRIIRRYPLMTGGACYHITDRIPDLPELANRLFRHVGLRGLANVEFKHDARDGQYKLIECNARFVASDCLVAESGINLAAYVYCRMTGRELPKMDEYALGMRLWDPVRDFQAQAALWRQGQLTLWRGLASVCRRQTFQYFQWTDPLPALARLTLPLRRTLGRVSG